ALVTGGSGGIGAAIARRLAREGLHVVVHAHRNRDAADQVAEDIVNDGGSAETVAFDVADAAASAQALEGLLESGPIQVLVNNAGIHADAPLAGMSPEQWHRVVDVTLHGFYHVTQPLLLPMLRTRWGRIISISSIAGVIGNRGQANYAAAKAGLHGASKSLALEIASRGVTVNVVAPGIITTPMAEQAFSKEQIEQLVPVKRAGTPDEVASLVGYLASPDAGYITGQVLSINGGMA
ncbi:MAG TPA: 3-oxoacyl-ACP reductase FabG, partial [Gammaproteobacteria bacterium]|nr:3-oxoacyl-ACP reductase FabG [Gammaproteobacteria bacterium]